MTLKAVQSSNIGAVGYEPETETLTIEFLPNRAGRIDRWTYTPVPVEAYEQMLNPAQSVGRLFAEVRRIPGLVSVKIGERQADEVPA